MTADLAPVSRAARKAASARDDFHAAIHAARASGATVRAIAEAAGLSHQRIHQILHGR